MNASIAPTRPGSPTMLNPALTQHLDAIAERFRDAKPFRHVVIDDFFAPEVAAELLEHFPAFERGNAMTENGTLGHKSTVEYIRKLGPIYAALDDAIQSASFLATIEHITGIPDLLYDPYYFGGGTHENRTGQDLDPHIDFNRHPVERWHRRLNLIVYLNRNWDDAWGGSLELHSDPRARHDEVTLVTPSFNRAVIFETTESSWHGFSRIALPPQNAGVTRKSVALYFYTRDRPAEEQADTHSTIYVERPLPPRYQPGMTLTKADVDELHGLFTRHDQHNHRLYREVTRVSNELAHVRKALFGGHLEQIRYLFHSVRQRLRK